MKNSTAAVTRHAGLISRTRSANGLTLSTTSLNPIGTVTNSGTGTGSTLISAVLGTNVTGVTQNSATSPLTLSGANTSTGLTTVSAGALRATSSPSALGALSAGNLALTAGTLELANDTGLNFARNTTVSGGATIKSDTLTAVPGATHTLGTLAIGAHTLSLAYGANVASGTAGVTFGTTTLSGAATLDTAANTAFTLAAVGETGSARSLTKQGAGSLTFTGSNSFTGGFTQSAGTTTVKTGASLSAASAPLAVNGGTLNLNNSAQTVSSLSGSGGTINFGTGHTLTLNQIGNNTLVSALGGAGNLNFSGGGTATLSGGGGGSGTFTASGGSTYQLGPNSGLPSSSNLTLTGGNLSLGAYTQTLGKLTLGAGVSTIDFGAGASTLVFAAITGQTSTGTLSIANYTAASGESLKFGTDSSSVTGGSLSAISFSGYSPSGATVTGGFVVPAGSAIPEPSTYAALAGALALLVAVNRSRSRSLNLSLSPPALPTRAAPPKHFPTLQDSADGEPVNKSRAHGPSGAFARSIPKSAGS